MDAHIEKGLKALFFKAVASFMPVGPDSQKACSKCNDGEEHEKKECLFFPPYFIKCQFDLCLNLAPSNLIYQRFSDLIDKDPVLTHKMVLTHLVGLGDMVEPLARLREIDDFRQEFFTYLEERAENHDNDEDSVSSSIGTDDTLILAEEGLTESEIYGHNSVNYQWKNLPN